MLHTVKSTEQKWGLLVLQSSQSGEPAGVWGLCLRWELHREREGEREERGGEKRGGGERERSPHFCLLHLAVRVSAQNATYSCSSMPSRSLATMMFHITPLLEKLACSFPSLCEDDFTPLTVQLGFFSWWLRHQDAVDKHWSSSQSTGWEMLISRWVSIQR